MNINSKLKILDWLDLHSLEEQSNCANKQIGAFLLDTAGNIVGSGYNYFTGQQCPSLHSGICPRRFDKTISCPAIHAEVSAVLDFLCSDSNIVNSKFFNDEIVDYLVSIDEFRGLCKGFSLYASFSPCEDCLRLLEYLGITNIFARRRHKKTKESKKLDIWLFEKIENGEYIFNLMF